VKKFSLVVFLSLLFIPIFSGGRDFCEEQLDRGIRNSEAYSYFLIEKSRANPSQKEGMLKEALRCSPDLPAVYFELAKANFFPSGGKMYRAYDYMLGGIEAYKRNFWWTFTLAGSLFLGLIISFVLSMFIIIIIRLMRDLPLLTHDIMERKNRMLLLIIVIISAFAGPLLLMGSILIVLGLYFKKADRYVVYLFLLFLFLSPWLLKASSIVFSIPSSSVLKAVVEVNESRNNRYALSVLKNSKDETVLSSYALALRREGHYDEAIEIYDNLIARNPDPALYNNLANCYVAKDDLEKAIQCYQQSIQIRPLVSAYYNMSQVLRRTLDLVEGEEYFLYAQKMDPDAITGFQAVFSQNPNRLVVDEVLPISALWEYSYSREKATGVSAFGLSILPPGWLPVLAVFIGALFYVLNKRMRARAYRCKKCGAIICNKCVRRVLWGNMCLRCYKSLIELHELDARERITRLKTVYDYQLRRRRILKVLSFLLPGSAYLYAGFLLKGFFMLWLFLFLLTAFMISSTFVIGMPYFPHLWLNWGAPFLLIVVFLVSNIITQRRLAKGWL
jgi:tetratricopeptide (TPR) repeat protein